MNVKTFLSFSLLAAFLWLAACQKSGNISTTDRQPKLPDTPYDYSLNIPICIDCFSSHTNFLNPQITNNGATLGRVLFYDPKLSLSNTIACASCHKQSLAFSDNVAGSLGYEGKITPRNAMAIINPVSNFNLFWDSRSNSVLDLAIRPIQNHVEMGMESLARLENKLSNVSYYPDLFEKAFGDRNITQGRIDTALAQFVCSISSTDSRFDQQQMLNFPDFTDLEKMGMDLFMSERTRCSHCHAGSNFSAPDFPGGPYGDDSFATGQNLRGGANNGLPLLNSDAGMGNGRFRIPSLRNIALTAPYMHDGRFKTLEEVVDHYNSGISNSADLDENLRNPDGSPLRPNLNALEKKALVAFLKTLTDESMTTDPKYSNPFN